MSESKLCKNCKSVLSGLYCSECGQKDTDLLSVKANLKEFTDNIFSFDSRFFITLKYLITKPGFLTIEYWSGKRTKYLPPLRLYLFISILYFFIISLINDDGSIFSKISDASNDVTVVDGSTEFPIDTNKNSGIIRIDDSDPQIFHYFVAIINKGIIISQNNNLSSNDLVFSNLPKIMFI